MDASQLTAVLVALATWVGFGSKMRRYFRFAKQRNAAKTMLIVAAYLCTLAQLVTIALTPQHHAAWLWIGIGGYVVANGLFWWALAAHGKSHPAFAFIRVPPSTLTTAGPYRLVRHPIYAAYLAAWCAGAAITAQPWLLLFPLFMGLFYFSAARQEEKSFLASDFATAYQEYRQRTGMFFPKIIRLPGRSRAA